MSLVTMTPHRAKAQGRLSLGLLVLLIAATAPAAELRTLKGDAIPGELVNVTNKEVVFAKGTEQVTVPVEQVLHLELGQPEKIPLDAAYVDVELNDGTLLHCSQCRLKGKNIEMTLLLTGQKLELPTEAVNNLLTSAQNETYRKEWTERLKKRVQKDVLARLNEGVVNPLPGLLGDGSEDGTKINFTLAGAKDPVAVPLERIHGLIFRREIDPNAKPPLCKLIDSFRDVVMVASIGQTPEGLTITTPSGAKLLYPLAKVALLDYSNGKLVFLSDLQPDRLVENSTEDRVDHFKRDRNMDGKEQIRLRNTVYPKGLALHADCRLDYDLNGEFSVFKFVPGFDDVVGGIPGPVKLRIEGDGKELFTRTFDRKSWTPATKAEPVALNIKDVQTLRIEVMTGDLLTLGKHLVLADAKVSK